MFTVWLLLQCSVNYDAAKKIKDIKKGSYSTDKIQVDSGSSRLIIPSEKKKISPFSKRFMINLNQTIFIAYLAHLTSYKI